MMRTLIELSQQLRYTLRVSHTLSTVERIEITIINTITLHRLIEESNRRPDQEAHNSRLHVLFLRSIIGLYGACIASLAWLMTQKQIMRLPVSLHNRHLPIFGTAVGVSLIAHSLFSPTRDLRVANNVLNGIIRTVWDAHWQGAAI